MFKRNPGRFIHTVILLKPSKPERDELGGLSPTTYTEAGRLLAMCEQKDQSRQPFIGDYVTVDTRYFVMRDITAIYPLDVTWRLEYKGRVYVIHDIRLLDESRPYYVQITATAINGNGGLT